MSIFTHTKRIVSKPITAFIQFAHRVGWLKVGLAGVGALVLVGVGIKLLPDAPTAELAVTPRLVEVRSVANLASGATPLSVVGEVSSQSEAQVRTESTGEVRGVYASLGDYVRAGQVIAELSNAREKAAVLQSEGVYDAAVAQLSKVKGGSREEQRAILQATLASAEESYVGAKSSAVSSLLAAYATIDDAVYRKADQMFSSGDTSYPRFLVQSSDAGLTSKLENERVQTQQILERQSIVAATLSEKDDLPAELSKTEAEARITKNFFDDLVSSLNKAVLSQSIPDETIAVYRADANAARASVSALLTALSATRDALSGKATAVSIAQKNLEQGVSGGQPEDVAAAEANVKQAQGALAGARANLEKTIVRAPIFGSINALPIKRGDFVSAFQPAVTIANNSALEIVAYVTDTEAKDIVVGTPVAIEGGVEGVITRLAPAVDPATKRVEVRIGVPSQGSLINGQAVTVTFVRGKTPSADTPTGPISIPISALKVGSDTLVVFSVNSDSQLVAHTVEIGTLLGDRVEIVRGIDPTLEIVTDARGLKEGDIVTVK